MSRWRRVAGDPAERRAPGGARCPAGLCRDVRPAAQLLSLSRQRKEPKKGDPTSAPLAARGARCGARGAGRVQKLAPAGLGRSALDGALRAPRPRLAALLAAAHGEGEEPRLAAHRLGHGASLRSRLRLPGIGMPMWCVASRGQRRGEGHGRASFGRRWRCRRRPLRGVRRCAPVPGCAPGGAVPFFVSPKKGTKERRPGCGAPRCARGSLRCSVRGGGRRTRPLRGLGQLRPTALRAATPRAPALLGAAYGTDETLSARCASPRRRRVAALAPG